MLLAYAAPMLKAEGFFSLSLPQWWGDVLCRAINCRWSENESDQIARPLRRGKASARSLARSISTDHRSE